MMSGSIYKKGLVGIIIILFLSLSIQSSIGVDIPVKKEIETVEDIDDCKPCQMEELFGDYNSIEMLKERLSTVFNKDLKNNENPIICNVIASLILSIAIPYFSIIITYAILISSFPQLYKSLENIINFYTDVYKQRMTKLCPLYEDTYDCGSILYCDYY